MYNVHSFVNDVMFDGIDPVSSLPDRSLSALEDNRNRYTYNVKRDVNDAMSDGIDPLSRFCDMYLSLLESNIYILLLTSFPVELMS